MALTYAFIDEDASSYGDVKRLDVTILRDDYPFVAQSQMFGGNTSILSPHDDADGVCIVRFGVVIIALFGGTDDVESALLQELDSGGEALLATHGQRVQRSGRGFDGIGVHADAVAVGDDDGINAGAVAGACDGSEIADVSYAVEHDEEGTLALFKQCGDKVFHVLVGNGGDEGDDTLVILERDAVELLRRHALHGNLRALEDRKEFACQVALDVSLYQNAVDVLSGLDGLYDGANAKYIF